MSRKLDMFDIPLRTIVGGAGITNIFSPTTKANPNGWLLLRQFTRRGEWFPATSFPISSTYSALAWFIRAKEAFAVRPGHDGVRLVFADGSLVAQHIKYDERRKGSRR